ncbi:MAG: 6-bladed beta-propeller [Bacteroidales bacterium]|nr:6-bladed beta-propeller [Bacteroidales bacterium]
MNIYKHIITGLIVCPYALCISSCHNSDSIYINDKYADTISINVDNSVSDIPVSKLFNKIEFVPLETGENCLVGSIDKILIHQGNYFILDQMSLSLFVFSPKGEFIHKICRVGRGPNEYTSLSDFFLDTENNRIILDADSKLLFFDLYSYQLIKESRPYMNTEKAYLGNETYAYYLRNGTWTGKYNIVVEKNGEIIYQNLPISEKNAGYTFSREWSFSQPMQNNEVFFAEPFDNNIYLLSKDSMIVKYYIDFGEFAFPETYFDDIPMQNWSERGIAAPYCSLVSDYYRNDNLLSFNFTYKGSAVYYFNFFNRREEFLFTGFNDDMLYAGTPVPMLYIDSTGIVSCMEVIDFKEGFENYKMIGDQMKEYRKEAEKAGQIKDWEIFRVQFENNSKNYYEQMKYLAGKNEEDNPIIVKWHFN